MKVFLTAALIAFVCATTQAFTDKETHEMFCSIPDPLAARWIDCIIKDAPESISKITGIIFECVDKYWEVTGPGDSILGVICYPEIVEDPNVKDCVEEKGKDLPHPSTEELQSMEEKIGPCFASAK
uniref:Putative venom gland protein n=1 Tax=Megacormus gertschi TaxID=1843536 RepID=A0A224XFD2_9SCOR